MNDEYKIRICGRKRSWPNFRYCTRTFREGLSKTVKEFSQDSRRGGCDWNPQLPEYEAASSEVMI